MEKLEEVEGGFTGTDGGSVDPRGKVGHWSARIKTAKEGRDAKGGENEKRGSKMEVDKVYPHETRVEVQGPQKKSDTCRVRRNAKQSGRCR